MGKRELLLPSSGFPEAVFGEAACHQPFAVRTEGGPNRAVLQITQIKIVNQLTRPRIPDFSPPTTPVPGCQPATVRAKGRGAQIPARDEELSLGPIQIVDDNVTGMRTLGHSSAIRAQDEFRASSNERGARRQAKRLGRANRNAFRRRMCGDGPALETHPRTVGDQALAL